MNATLNKRKVLFVVLAMIGVRCAEARQHVFETPPVGWMTWYAIKFDASEATILENARNFNAKFGGYTVEKPVLWIDWEWYHRKFNSFGADGEDALTPHAANYPHGLKWLHDELAGMGFTPALWISPHTDVRTNALLRAHPEWIFQRASRWFGQLLTDPTAPGYVEGYLKPQIDLYRSWGYRVFKWDVFPYAIGEFRKHPEHFARCGTTSDAAVQRMLRAGRQLLGEDSFLLYCHSTATTFDAAYDNTPYCDAMRVGEDVWEWKGFIKNCLVFLTKFAPKQSDDFWPDGDNLVLREPYSTEAMARTRVTIYSLFGIPITIGDAISTLDDARVAMLRQAMPVVPTWRERRKVPTECDGKTFDIAVDFNRGGESWTMKSFSNLLTNETRQVTFDATGCAVWDVWNRRLLANGTQSSVSAIIAPADTLLVRLTPLPSHNQPIVIGNDRHLTQVVPPTPSVPVTYYVLDGGRVIEKRQ